MVMIWLHLKQHHSINTICLLLAAGLLCCTSALQAVRVLFHNLFAHQPFPIAEVVKKRGAVELTFHPARSWRVHTGQYIYLSAPSVSFWQAHPFSIIWWKNAPDGRAATVSMIAKIKTNFTRALALISHQ